LYWCRQVTNLRVALYGSAAYRSATAPERRGACPRRQLRRLVSIQLALGQNQGSGPPDDAILLFLFCDSIVKWRASRTREIRPAWPSPMSSRHRPEACPDFRTWKRKGDTEAAHEESDEIAVPRAERLVAICFATSWTLADFFVVADYRESSSSASVVAPTPRTHTLAARIFHGGHWRIARNDGERLHDVGPVPSLEHAASQPRRGSLISTISTP
jgi:hypothetical protein